MRLLNVVVKSALCVALAASAVLFVDYRAGSHASFCGVASGCAQVRASPYSQVAGISLPTVGIAVFAALFLLSLAGARFQRVLASLLACVALGALGLIGLQLFVVRALCAWCMAVDVSALIAAAAALAVWRHDVEPDPPLVRVLWAVAGAVAVAVPIAAGATPVETDLPKGIAELKAPGKVTVVTFTDFECPFCRLMHPVIDETAREYGDRVAVVRVMTPLSIHPGAEPAARVYLCAPAEVRERLADRLYNAKLGTLNRRTALEHATALGVDRQALEDCYGSTETDARLASDRKLFEEAELRGLPSTFVESEMIEGAETDAFREAVARALEGRRGGATWLVVVLAMVLAGAAGASVLAARGSGRARAPEPAGSAPS